MEYRFLGRTGVRVSKLAMGTMGMGPDAEADRAVFAACLDAGVNVFDCADVYNQGAAEVRLGELAREHRDELVLTTKAYFPTGPGPNARGASRYHLVRAVEASLKRLNTDYIDVFFLHRFDDATALQETLRAVEDLVRQGKVLYPAVSNFAAWQAQAALGVAAAHDWAPLVCVQPMYNLVKRQAEVEILPMALANQVAVMPYSPLGGGLLTGKYGVDKRPDGGRIVDNPMYSVRYGDALNYEVAARFTALAAEVGMHPVTMALAWVDAHPAVTTTLMGARNVDQLAPSLAVADLTLDPELYARISALSPTPPPATDRNEETSSHNYGSR